MECDLGKDEVNPEHIVALRACLDKVTGLGSGKGDVEYVWVGSVRVTGRGYVPRGKRKLSVKMNA